MKQLKILAPAILALSLTGCIKPTTYHPFDGRYGYQTVQMNSRLFEVHYSGNVATSKGAVHNMMLYRAAEVTRQHGYTYFSVLSQRTQRHRSVIVTPGYTDTTVIKDKHHRHHHRRHGDKQVITSYTPPTKTVENAYTTVIRFRLTNQGGGSRVYNAKTLTNSLRGQIAWPKAN